MLPRTLPQQPSQQGNETTVAQNGGVGHPAPPSCAGSITEPFRVRSHIEVSIKPSMVSSSPVLPLSSCSNPALAGGKAAGLARLIAQGFQVPPGLCVTTQVYRDALADGGLNPSERWNHIRRAPEAHRESLLADVRRAVVSLVLPRPVLEAIDTDLLRLEQTFTEYGSATGGMLWAVRSSASDEDSMEASFGGIYHTVLGVPRDSITAAILDCWASQWTALAFAYRERVPKPHASPMMAIILQPLLVPRAAGVAYSRHPLSGRTDHIMINAVFGLAESLVSGLMRPDQYVVENGKHPDSLKLIHRDIAEKATVRIAKPWGLINQPLPESDRNSPVLEEQEILVLARLVQQVEAAAGRPVDVEWANDAQGFWLLQARPIPERATPQNSPATVWSRANFKETLPELPSPLGLSLLNGFMETHIVECYRALGCRIPPGSSSVRIIRGRPFINVTLFQSVMTQLGGDPTALADQMGGEATPVTSMGPRLPWWRIIVLMEWKIRRAISRSSKWFREMDQLGARGQHDPARTFTPTELTVRNTELTRHILTNGDLTFAFFNGVSQALYVMNLLLERRLGNAWRPLLNQTLRGVGTVISANQIIWLAKLAEAAECEPVARDFLVTTPWAPRSFRTALAGTNFLRAFDAYLEEYGNRAIGESDIMSRRFSEIPEYVLGVIRGHLLSAPARRAQDIHQEQKSSRQDALRRLRTAFGWRWHEWAVCMWWHRRLCRLLELREANRHALMHFMAYARSLATDAGTTWAASGILESRDDIFFLTRDEVGAIASGVTKNWKGLVEVRRKEREAHATQDIPDRVIGNSNGVDEASGRSGCSLQGLPVSAGCAEGPVCLLLSPDDLKKVKRGDILVSPMIDPGMAPLMGLAAGLVAQMGGILSHGAIIAREYGLPAIVNVHGVTGILKDGERVVVDATAGVITRLGHQGG